MPPSDGTSLWSGLNGRQHLIDKTLSIPGTSVSLGEFVRSTCLGGQRADLRGSSVLIATQNQLTAGLAMIEVDGLARRLILCPPDLAREHLPGVIGTGAVDTIISDRPPPDLNLPDGGRIVSCSATIRPSAPERGDYFQTEWVLLTSGTTGAPKMVSHSLSSLTDAIKVAEADRDSVIWSTFYDIRRYGGLQIFLRAVLGGASLVLSSAGEATGDFLNRAGAAGVTHISGTPSHWRRALMSPSAHRIAPRYVRLSGEIADQAILDNLRAFYKDAKIAHAFASTEAGVAFDVADGIAGFPAAMLGRRGDVELRVENGSLLIRSPRTAAHYLSHADGAIADKDGFVDTGDMVELRGDRYYFVGRRGGIINVGGLKVHPEEVEGVINRHPSVRMSLVRARKNPITGAVVVADIVVRSDLGADPYPSGSEALKAEILEACHRALAPHKVPAAIRFVPALDVGAAGKLARFGA